MNGYFNSDVDDFLQLQSYTPYEYNELLRSPILNIYVCVYYTITLPNIYVRDEGLLIVAQKCHTRRMYICVAETMRDQLYSLRKHYATLMYASRMVCLRDDKEPFVAQGFGAINPH